MDHPIKTLEAGTPGGEAKKTWGLLFVAFCLWTFVLLSRPQDLFTALAAIRPALATGALVLVLVIFRTGELGKAPLLKETQIKLYLVLFLVMFLGIPFSWYAHRSFNAVLTDYVYVVFFVMVFYKIVDSDGKLLTVIFFASVGTGLYAVFSLATGTVWEKRLWAGRMFDPNDLGFFALSFLPLNLIFISRENPAWKRLAVLGSFLACILLILQTGSRGGIIALVVSLIMLFFIKTKTVKRTTKIILFALGIGLVAFNSSKINFERYETVKDFNDDYNMWDETGRINIWKIGLKAMLANPLTGVGVNNFNEAIGRDRARRGLATQYWQTAHNMLVQIGTETGIIGMGLFIFISINIYLTLRKAKKYSRSEHLVKIGEMGTVAFAGHFVSGMFLSQAYSIYWAFFVGLSAVANHLLASELANETPTLEGIVSDQTAITSKKA